MANSKKKVSSIPVYFTAGTILLLLGSTLILKWWPELVIVFKGLIGMGLALAGLLLLYMIRD